MTGGVAGEGEGDLHVVTPEPLEPWGRSLRPVALVMAIVSMAMLALYLLVGGGADSDVAGAADAADSSADRTATPTPIPTSTPTPNPFAVSSEAASLTITRLWSPAPSIARAEGTLAAPVEIMVVSNGVDLSTVALSPDPDGNFAVDIVGLAPGPQELCLADACQRVLVADPDQEDPAVIEQRIRTAIERADARFDFDNLLPEWQFVVGGPNSSVGGTANATDRTITVNANPGRSEQDYFVTVLHEIAHAIDTDYLTDADRAVFGQLRGHDPSLVWGDAGDVHSAEDRWLDPAEDFAEVFVAWALDGEYQIQSTAIAEQPSAGDLAVFCVIISASGLPCS